MVKIGTPNDLHPTLGPQRKEGTHNQKGCVEGPKVHTLQTLTAQARVKNICSLRSC